MKVFINKRIIGNKNVFLIEGDNYKDIFMEGIDIE
jgi:hypothetical protein